MVVNGIPTKKKVIRRSLVDVNKVKAAVTKLKEINWLYDDSTQIRLRKLVMV